MTTKVNKNLYRHVERFGLGPGESLAAMEGVIDWMLGKLRPHLNCDVNVSHLSFNTFDFDTQVALKISMEIVPRETCPAHAAILAQPKKIIRREGAEWLVEESDK